MDFRFFKESIVGGQKYSLNIVRLAAQFCERHVRCHNKRLGWLGSSSAVGVFDSNDRDQAEQYLVLLRQAGT